ncbi:hypothetical protein LF1_08860 [Rubripirellula obstinata]|uniref:Apea-like HEPN domain-containing protein n=1 Tax=Rubripirellula obstinata TaxID=406547 RepID=A0A5B1CB99_9BACT|nr:hypothetical protein [Rubripirellula obstinata]KAA1258367.1 hypothetical protein LF1_08860 [Rubripirellula obstinata]
MWLPDNPDDANDPGSVFLLAAWHELFFGFTPDSFQPRLHNVPSLVEELIDMGGLWQNEPRNVAHVEKLKAELNAAIKSEDAILSQIPTYKSRAMSLAKAKTPEAIIAGGGILAGQSRSYWRAFESLLLSTVSELPNRKQDAIENLRRLATFAFQHGKEDDDVWEPLDKSANRCPVDVLRQMIALTRESEKEYSCTLTILGEVAGMHSTVRKCGHKVVSVRDLPDDYTAALSNYDSKPLHVRVDVDAKSIRHAVADARERLELAIGIASLYQNPPELRLHPTAFVSSSGQDKVFVQSEQAFRRLYPRTNAKRDIKHAIELVSKTKVDRRILAAVKQLALASGSSDTRTRFVNLWSSVETLAGSHEGETTMERVSELIVPLVISRHVHRTTRYMTILTQRFGNTIGSTQYGSGFRETENGVIFSDDMLVALTSKCRDPKIADLLRFADHPLLRFRLYDTWKIFHDPKQLRSRLETSKQRLEWQVARIYRARNLLVHEGREVPHIVPLLDNLQNYLSMLVQRLIHETKRNATNEWGVRHCIEYWKGRMHHSLDGLKENPSSLTTRDFLEKGQRIQLWNDR